MKLETLFFDPASWWAWLALLGVPLVWWRWYSHRRATVSFSSLNWLGAERTTLRQRMRILLPLLRSFTILLLAVCLARPQKGDEQTRIFAEGIAIQMVVDVSGSMEALDFELDGKPVNRLDAIKHVSREFLKGNGDDLRGRPDDLAGLVVFGTYADSLAPLTLDHDMVLKLLDDTQSYGSVEVQKKLVAMQQEMGRLARTDMARARSLEVEFNSMREEGGTAIGDAIALGVERLQGLERDRRSYTLTQADKMRSKVMILLTDGAQTHGTLEPTEGADLATKVGVKIYTIGVGTRGRFVIPMVDRAGQVHRVEPDDYRTYHLDEPTLQEVAKRTGGQYFRAKDTQSLRQVYDSIDKLEKTKTEERRYLQSREMATEFVELGNVTVPPLLLGVVISLALEIVLANTWLRRSP